MDGYLLAGDGRGPAMDFCCVRESWLSSDILYPLVKR